MPDHGRNDQHGIAITQTLRIRERRLRRGGRSASVGTRNDLWMESRVNSLLARFDLPGLGTTVRTEVLAGVTTWLAMAYIVVVNPSILAAAGMDAGAVSLSAPG